MGDLDHPDPAGEAVLYGDTITLPPADSTLARKPAGTALEPGWPVVPGYEIRGVLGRGGMGVVYSAHDLRLGRDVALKMIRPGPLDTAAERERFRTEARAAARLAHPHIVPIHDLGEVDGQPFYTLTLVPGSDLRSLLPRLREDSRQTAQLLLKVADAVHYAHTNGILHRDLKPGNILLDEDGEPHVTDFGLAWPLREDPTSTGQLLGTPSYMAPELLTGTRALTPAVDVYGLGAILYECLTGRPPFKAATLGDTLQQVLQAEPVRPRHLRAAIPANLEVICLKCLEKDPARRYPSAAELAEDLRRFLLDQGMLRPRLAERVRRWLRDVWPEQRLPSLPRPEDALPEPQALLLGAILDGLSDGVVVADPDGRLVLCNHAAERLLGLSLAGLTLDAWAERQPHWMADGVTAYPARGLPLARALRGEVVEKAEVFLLPEGRAEGLWISMSARPLRSGAMVVLRDNTEEHALRDSQALYFSLVESLPLSLFRKDARGCFTFANQTFCTTMGLPAERIVGRTDHDFLSPVMAERYRADELRVLARGTIEERLEEHLSGACGNHCRCAVPAASLEPEAAEQGPRYVHVLLAPVVDATGRVVGTQGAFWNVTARLRAENQLRQTAAELRRTNAELARSNADLQQFAYAASHDLRAPLRTVASFTQLLKRRYDGQLDADADDFIRFAVDGVTRMQGLLDGLLAYSRVGTHGKSLQETSCDEVFDEAVANLSAEIADNRAVVLRDPLPTVRSDRTQLVQLFQNLIGNAIKFRSSLTPRVHVSARYRHAEWLFAVRDNGIGIRAEDTTRIFDIFKCLHTPEEYPGHGIGLAVCKKIVERHGGRIWVESEPGEGSVFSFTMPVEWFEAGD
jgi:serine/threonine protein kinase/signal transduction histidine kinase